MYPERRTEFCGMGPTLSYRDMEAQHLKYCHTRVLRSRFLPHYLLLVLTSSATCIRSTRFRRSTRRGKEDGFPHHCLKCHNPEHFAVMIRPRSVSPLGASRFEQPSIAPSSLLSSNTTSSRTSSMSVNSFPPENSSSTTATSTTLGSHFQHDHDMDLDSKNGKYSYNPTSPIGPDSSDGDAEEWFNRFRSDPDFSAYISDACPDRKTLANAYDTPIYSADGSSRPFGALFDPAYATHQRQLFIFVRHFYCGACQAYLKALTAGIPMQDYFSIAIPTSIIVIGCGQPDLIPQYKKFTNCPFPIFTDPTRALFKQLGMVVNLNVGTRRPEYMQDISLGAWAMGQVTQVRASMKESGGIRKRDVLRGGHPMQIGGEFLIDDGEAVWCKRMKNYRDHAEIGVLRKVLELDEF
nr:thioredoxin-like protein aaed1 [Quercus suber]